MGWGRGVVVERGWVGVLTSDSVLASPVISCKGASLSSFAKELNGAGACATWALD